ncbi:Glycerophosphoryl diester phosphodiesterase family [Seminavis robusta]|uniref:Glycerophosphoryl diester phosphodiesterase family n=1 Tax=Seminavis robusta TaxID=568900 RepID=A0A9N8EVB0_9STRA|nr:Glycerophosphoryl diester phosphodiesterase family [Seminavis robusta]|eukprot:Sro1671_g290050.1 Glycerophosphoryl diester phosphodiesterase family (457) ;mRNA; r:8782-10236
MRTVQSLTSLSTLAVGSTVAFSSSLAWTQSHSSLVVSLAVVPSANGIPIPPPVEPILENTMSTSLSSSTAAFVANTQPFLADPTQLLGKQQVSLPAGLAMASVLAEEETLVADNAFLWVPPNKSLRNKLKLPTTGITQLASSTEFQRPRIVGHRGSLYEELENTRAAFLACAGICDAVELDVFLLKDGNVVVFHGSGDDRDPGLLREYCTNVDEVQQGATSILDLTLEEAQKLQFSTSNAELAAPAAKIQQGKIPTLEQVLLDLQPTGMEVKIELKGPGTARPVLDLVDRLNMVQQVSYSSFNLNEIETVRQLKPQQNSNGNYVYRTGALFDEVPLDYIEQARAVGASEVHLRYDTCTVDRIKQIHGAGMGSMVWMRGPVGMKADATQKFWDIGNEDESCFSALVETGVQQLCVNRPKVLYDLLEKQPQKQSEVQEDPVVTVAAWPLQSVRPVLKV